jgi:hypothetical protein
MARMTTREKMRRVLARWRRSGLSAAEFCRREGLAPHRLSYWKRSLKRSGAAVTKGPASPVDFVPVRLVDQASNGMAPGALEISLSGGDRVAVGPDVSAERLRDVVAILRERC